MKKHSIFLFILLIMGFLGNGISAQNQQWKVKAVKKKGNFLDVKAFTSSGEAYDVVAITLNEKANFLDVKVVKGSELLPVKMMISNDFYVPVKAIDSDGSVLDIKAVLDDTLKMDVKGVNRAGNTIVMAAVDQNDNFYSIKAISPEGRNREVAGVKFQDENIEMELNGIQILAHVKAIPSLKVDTRSLVWEVKAIDGDGNSMPVVAIDRKGNEYSVKALVSGGNFQLLNVKAIVNYNEVGIKLMKKDGKIELNAIDDKGFLLPVKVKTKDGALLDIAGIESGERIYDIKAIMGNNPYAVKAISEDGDIYDVKGFKAYNKEAEGEILGLVYSHFFFAHVKALPGVD